MWSTNVSHLQRSVNFYSFSIILDWLIYLLHVSQYAKLTTARSLKPSLIKLYVQSFRRSPLPCPSARIHGNFNETRYLSFNSIPTNAAIMKNHKHALSELVRCLSNRDSWLFKLPVNEITQLSIFNEIFKLSTADFGEIFGIFSERYLIYIFFTCNRLHVGFYLTFKVFKMTAEIRSQKLEELQIQL